MKSTGALGALGLVLLGLVGYASNTASAAPICKRVASQWAAVFKAKCTQWYHEGNDRMEGHPPAGCTQVSLLRVLFRLKHVVVSDGEMNR